MGEDLFWAIRGGGGGSFGIVLAWKINLVTVPEIVTVCSVNRALEQNLTSIIHRWQYVAPDLPHDVYPSITIATTNTTPDGNNRTVVGTFNILFLGRATELLPLMQQRFPELGLVEEDCFEMSYVDSIIAMGMLPNRTDILLDREYRVPFLSLSFKTKSDYVKTPLPETGFQGIWSRLLNEPGGSLNFAAYGAKMAEIPESSIPYPHRSGNLYKISYNVRWPADSNDSERYMSWIRNLYSYMGSYVSKSPREAYINYRDLDVGVNNVNGNTSYRQASVWGRKYFKNNFNRLVRVKTMADPHNFFRHEQSIPSFFS